MEIGTLPGKASFAPFNTEYTCFYSLQETLNPYISAGCNLKTNCRLNLLLVFPPYIPEKYPVVTEKYYRKLFPPIWKSYMECYITRGCVKHYKKVIVIPVCDYIRLGTVQPEGNVVFPS